MYHENKGIKRGTLSMTIQKVEVTGDDNPVHNTAASYHKETAKTTQWLHNLPKVVRETEGNASSGEH